MGGIWPNEQCQDEVSISVDHVLVSTDNYF